MASQPLLKATHTLNTCRQTNKTRLCTTPVHHVKYVNKQHNVTYISIYNTLFGRRFWLQSVSGVTMPVHIFKYVNRLYIVKVKSQRAIL